MSTGNAAPPEAVGRVCPYCRVALEDGAGVVFCTACGAVHHDDCWKENDGCAVALCVGGPSLREDDADEHPEPPTVVVPPPPSPPSLPPAPPPPVVAKPAGPPPPPPEPPAPGGAARPSRNWIPLIAALVIVLLGGASAGAIVLSSDEHDSSTTVEATQASESELAEDEPVEEEELESGEEGFEYEEEVEPELSPAQLARGQIQRSLRSHFNDLVNGYYHAAYRDLTSSVGEEIGGESSWVAAQEEDQLQGFTLRVDAELSGANSARAAIEEFETRSLANGCQDWSGYWEMLKVYGEWLISAAKLESEPC